MLKTVEEQKTVKQVWREWKKRGIKPSMTYLELMHLAKHVNQECEDLDADPQEIDFQGLLDATLDYYENLTLVDMQIKQLNADFNGVFQEIGTERLREKYQVLMSRYRKLRQRILRKNKTIKRLRNRLKPKKVKKRKKRKTHLCSK